MVVSGRFDLGTVGKEWMVVRPSAPGSAVGLFTNEGAEQEGWPSTPHGSQFAFLTGRKSDLENRSPNYVFQQVLGGSRQDVVSSGKKYTLTVSIVNLTDPGEVVIGLYADPGLQEPLVEKNIKHELSFNEWQDVSVEWIAGEADASRDVFVGFVSRDFRQDSGGRLGIDAVRLSVSEPTSEEIAAAARTTSTATPRAIDLDSRGLIAGRPELTGRPLFEMQELFKGRGGRSIVVAADGGVIAFHSPGTGIRKSSDGGMSWGEAVRIGKDARGNALVDETNGDILLVDPSHGHLWRSRNNGGTWSRETIRIEPNRFGHGAPDGVIQSAAAAESGITLRFGNHPGRLLMPTRIMAPNNQNRPELFWKYNYNSAIYSDDNGRTWRTSAPFPVLGTGEGALAELSDGTTYYNSRTHTATDSMRRAAWSYDDGESWINPQTCPQLPDGMTGNDYGCHGGLVRLPYRDVDILLFSNVDGRDPGGGKRRGGDRRNVTVWASFDGAKTWPIKRSVYSGPSAYSALAAGRPGTQTEGIVYMLFEGGPEGEDSAVQAVRFNLDWLLGGEATGDGKIPEWLEANANQ